MSANSRLPWNAAACSAKLLMRDSSWPTNPALLDAELGGAASTGGLGAGMVVSLARLFISPKTVSVQVSAIMRKVGATSRTEAARHATKTDAAPMEPLP